MTRNTRILQEVSNLNRMRNVMMLTMFTVLTLLSSLSTVHAAYGLWYTTGSLKCDFPDGSIIARVKVYLLKKGASLLPFPLDLICSYTNSDTETGITTTKPTSWRVEWLFLVNGYEACRFSTSDSGFPVTVDNKCFPGQATVTIGAPTHQEVSARSTDGRSDTVLSRFGLRDACSATSSAIFGEHSSSTSEPKA